MITHLTYVNTSLICRILGRHHFKRMHTDLKLTVNFGVVSAQYSACRFCKTRTAEVTGPFDTNRVDMTWLRRYAP